MRTTITRRTRLVSAAFVSLALVVAACGDDDEETDTTPAAAPDTTAGSATTAASVTTGASETSEAAVTTGGSETSESADTSEPATTTDPAEPTTSSASAPSGPADQAAYDAALAELVTAAEEEGSVTVYSSISEASLNQMAEAFEELYDIDVQPVRMTDAETIPRVETELSTDTAGADVVTAAALGWIETQAAAGSFLPLTASPSVAGLGVYDAEQYVRPDGPVETGAAVLTFAWNTELLPEGLTGYADIIGNEDLQGNLGVIDPSAGGPAVVDFYAFLTENFGEDYIPALAEMEPRLYPSALPIGEALQSGEIAATPYAAPVQLIPAKANGAPVEFGIDEKGAWGARYFTMMPKTAANPNAAALWTEFYLSEEGQKLAHTGAGMVIPGVEGALITNDKVRKMDTEVMAADNVAAFNAEFDSLFK